MIECFTVHNPAENRLYHFVSEDHANRYADHLGADAIVDLSEITELTTMRDLQHEDHHSKCEALLSAVGA